MTLEDTEKTGLCDSSEGVRGGWMGVKNMFSEDTQRKTLQTTKGDTNISIPQTSLLKDGHPAVHSEGATQQNLLGMEKDRQREI